MTKTTALVAIAGLLSLTAALGTVLRAAPPTRAVVAYYDGQRVYAGSREASAAMDAATKASRDAASRATDDFNAAAKSPISTEDLQVKRTAAQKVIDDAGAGAKQASAIISAKVDERIRIAAGQIATKRGISIVLPLSGRLPYADPACDLTTEVIAAVDAGGPVK